MKVLKRIALPLQYLQISQMGLLNQMKLYLRYVLLVYIPYIESYYVLDLITSKCHSFFFPLCFQKFGLSPHGHHFNVAASSVKPECIKEESVLSHVNRKTRLLRALQSDRESSATKPKVKEEMRSPNTSPVALSLHPKTDVQNFKEEVKAEDEIKIEVEEKVKTETDMSGSGNSISHHCLPLSSLSTKPNNQESQTISGDDTCESKPTAEAMIHKDSTEVSASTDTATSCRDSDSSVLTDSAAGSGKICTSSSSTSSSSETYPPRPSSLADTSSTSCQQKVELAPAQQPDTSEDLNPSLDPSSTAISTAASANSDASTSSINNSSAILVSAECDITDKDSPSCAEEEQVSCSSEQTVAAQAPISPSHTSTPTNEEELSEKEEGEITSDDEMVNEAEEGEVVDKQEVADSSSTQASLPIPSYAPPTCPISPPSSPVAAAASSPRQVPSSSSSTAAVNYLERLTRRRMSSSSVGDEVMISSTAGPPTSPYWGERSTLPPVSTIASTSSSVSTLAQASDCWGTTENSSAQVDSSSTASRTGSQQQHTSSVDNVTSSSSTAAAVSIDEVDPEASQSPVTSSSTNHNHIKKKVIIFDQILYFDQYKSSKGN